MFGLSSAEVKKKPIIFLGYSKNNNKNTRLPCVKETDTIPLAQFSTTIATVNRWTWTQEKLHNTGWMS